MLLVLQRHPPHPKRNNEKSGIKTKIQNGPPPKTKISFKNTPWNKKHFLEAPHPYTHLKNERIYVFKKKICFATKRAKL